MTVAPARLILFWNNAFRHWHRYFDYFLACAELPWPAKESYLVICKPTNLAEFGHVDKIASRG